MLRPPRIVTPFIQLAQVLAQPVVAFIERPRELSNLVADCVVNSPSRHQRVRPLPQPFPAFLGNLERTQVFFARMCRVNRFFAKKNREYTRLFSSGRNLGETTMPIKKNT